MKKLIVMMTVVLICGVVSADVIRGIDMDFVTIGNAGNSGDTRVDAYPSGCGSVGYDYQIGKYEVTNSQWDAFTLLAGAPIGNPSYAYDETSRWTGTNVPTNKVSWVETAQFCNYLTSGDKSQGAYLFGGNNVNPGVFLSIDRDSAVSTYEIVYVLPTEDEWYKAAYYTGSGYSTYANGQNTIPVADNGWNYYGGSSIYPWDVGTGTMEQNGTFDMMGNVSEWNEMPGRFRGGTYGSGISSLGSLGQGSADSHYEYDIIGFRVVSIPEPCSLALLGLGGLALYKRKRY